MKKFSAQNIEQLQHSEFFEKLPINC